MLTLDRLKLVSSSNNITNLNPSHFLKVPTRQGDFYYKYHQDTPFYLTIINNPRKSELVLEFTGKILKNDYSKLICGETLYECLQTINHIGVCELDIDGIVTSAEVCRCDVTMDVECPFPIKEIKRHLKACISNYDKWRFHNCENNGLVLENNATTPKHRRRLILYDKEKELHKANNRDFIDWVSDKDGIECYFKNKVRFELNLVTKSQVRKLLHIQDNKLTSVMNSTAHPILEVFDLAINENRTSTTTIYGKPDKLALLEQCNYDLQAVEMRLRDSTPRTSSISRKLEPYRKLLQNIQTSGQPSMNIRELIVR